MEGENQRAKYGALLSFLEQPCSGFKVKVIVLSLHLLILYKSSMGFLIPFLDMNFSMLRLKFL